MPRQVVGRAFPWERGRSGKEVSQVGSINYFKLLMSVATSLWANKQTVRRYAIPDRRLGIAWPPMCPGDLRGGDLCLSARIRYLPGIWNQNQF